MIYFRENSYGYENSSQKLFHTIFSPLSTKMCQSFPSTLISQHVDEYILVIANQSSGWEEMVWMSSFALFAVGLDKCDKPLGAFEVTCWILEEVEVTFRVLFRHESIQKGMSFAFLNMLKIVIIKEFMLVHKCNFFAIIAFIRTVPTLFKTILLRFTNANVIMVLPFSVTGVSLRQPAMCNHYYQL